MKKLNLGCLIFASYFSLSYQALAAWQNIGSAEPKSAEVQVISSDERETILDYRVLGFDLDTVAIGGKNYSTVSIPAAGTESKVGFPALPRISKNIHLPLGATAQLVVEKMQTQDFAVAPIAPSKGELTRNIDPASVNYTFANEVYAAKKNSQYPAQSFLSGKEFMIRKARGVNLSFFPVQYLPAKGIIRVTTHAVVKIKTESKGIGRIEVDSVDDGWANILKGSFLNSDKIKELDPSQKALPTDRTISHFIKDTGRTLVITPTAFRSSLNPLLTWKTQKGMRISVKEVADDATYETVKSLVQTAYDTDKISYVLLVGDAEFLPFHPGTSGNAAGQEADPMYGLVEGNDSYPDLVVSRFSVKTTAELDTMVAKAVQYEKTPDLQGDWYAKGVGVASNQGSPTDWQRAEVLRGLLEAYNYTKVDKQYDPTANKNVLTQQINEGRGFINYTGHGSPFEWGTTGFSNSDVDALKNTGKLPFIVSVACVNGQFSNLADVFAERWLKAGTPEAPRGAIAIFASSTNQSWDPPTVGQLAITQLLTADQYNTIGSLFFHGSIAVLEDASDSAEQTFQTWHIFGDGTTQVRTKVPTAIETAVPTSVNLENSEIVLQVGEKGLQAGVVQGEKLLGAGISDETGTLKIKIDTSIATHEPGLLTLTGYNKIPKISEVAFP
jgi:hypothetical protein